MSDGRFKKGMTPFNKRDWTTIDSIIVEKYSTMGSDILPLLGISKNILYLRASKLGVSCTVRKPASVETRVKVSTRMKSVVKTSEWKSKLSESLKGKSHSTERLEAIAEGLRVSRKKPVEMTKPEIFTKELCNYLFGAANPFEFTGHRDFWVTMPNGRPRNPDFVWIDHKKIIEVFGRYWHRNDNEQEIVKAYADAGWSCLILWDDELDASVRDRVLEFAYPYEYDAEMQELNECLPFA